MPSSNAHRTAEAALACIGTLSEPMTARTSPLYRVMEMANRLELDRRTARRAAVIRNNASGPASSRISAWSLRFSRDTCEKPLLYLMSSATSAELCAISAESAQRGILCNDVETLPSPWPKGAQPSLPLWLASHPLCTPFDPASGDEAQAIVLAALRSLYVDAHQGFYYLALHDRSVGPELSQVNTADALKGMYRFCAGDGELKVRLLGAGLVFQEVLAAGQLLESDWGVAADVWSCPSYTRLARETDAAQRCNRLHPLAAKRASHLQRCLGDNADPVVAVTGYPQNVVDQLAPFIDARFVALGAGSLTPGLRGAPAPDRYWIVAMALGALADDQRLSHATAEQALQRYGLT